MTLFHERFKAGKINTPVQRIEKQQQGLQKIGHCMTVLQNIVNSSFAACQLLKTDFIATDNTEIQNLMKECYTIAKSHGVDFHLDISDYNYINPEKHTKGSFGIPGDLQKEEWNPEEHGTDLEYDYLDGMAYAEEREWQSSNC